MVAQEMYDQSRTMIIEHLCDHDRVSAPAVGQPAADAVRPASTGGHLQGFRRERDRTR
jgi:hypothetical protein